MPTVNVRPLPVWARNLNPRLWPIHPPIFPDGEPDRAGLELALDLIEALDADSQRHYESAYQRIRAALGL
jgi:hypothetical protein